MAPTMLITESQTNITLSPNIGLYDFPLLENTTTNQKRTTNPNNAATAAWDKLLHQKITTNPTIAALTRKHCDAFERTFHIADYFWKQGLTFLTPQIRQKIHQYNLRHGSIPKLLSPNPPPPLEGTDSFDADSL